MNALLQCLSHTPIKGHFDPPQPVIDETREIVSTLSRELNAFEPELIFLFAPDHYNGFFLDTMPQFCIGMAATALGDYGTAAGPLNVPREAAEQCAEFVVAHDIDLAISYRMPVDHGFAQPLEELAGGLAIYPVVPIFINAVAPPLVTMRRARQFGQAVGAFAATVGRRVAFLGSGGLSHNPPVPVIANAPPEVAERIIAGRSPTAEARAARQCRTIEAAQQFASGASALTPLNPPWDLAFMRHLADKDWAALDAYTNAGVTAEGGASAHEVKTWVAAAAAMNAATGGRYAANVRYYRAIPEWIAGYGALSGHSL